MSEEPRRVAVVVGASRGLGRDLALAIASHGADVVIAGRNEADLRETSKLICETGAQPLVVRTDICSLADVEVLRARTEDRFGLASILINSAGVFGPLARIANGDSCRWIETIEVNTLGPYLTCRAFAGQMVAGGWGRIVNVSSAAPLYPPGPLNSAYATSKAALNQMTRHLAAELAGTGVTANVIHPGSLKTEMWADIRRQVLAVGDEAGGLRSWVEMVETTGGDSTSNAVELVLGLIGPDSGETNGLFC